MTTEREALGKGGELEPVPREVLERVAYIMGASSAAAAALKAADELPCPVRFYRDGRYFVIEMLQSASAAS